jgi:hypothetical protein
VDPVTGSSEYGNDPSGSIKGGEISDQLSGYHFLENDCNPRTLLRKFIYFIGFY